ncbi:MAG: GNAT family N-acetyltransferase [Pseudolabrys sp.]|nr:GNAT family N-acetyltransferase [Pseudolabrys sp.]
MRHVFDLQTQLCGDVLEREALPSLVPAWEKLCARAIEDNVYFTPRYTRALIDNIESNRSLRFAVVWQGAELVALMPFTRSKVELSFLGTAARAWQTEYSTSCVPLLDRTRATQAADGLVKLLTAINQGEWIISAVNTNGAACNALMTSLANENRPWRISNGFERATLKPGDSFDGHMQKYLSSKRRRELKRNRRRLEKIGEIQHESHYSGAGLTRAVEAFLDIEASGWKGQRGTALKCRPETRQFAFDAFTGGASDSICRADALTLDGTPIAVSLTVLAGGTGFTVKCAYDEAYRSYSPGLLLEIDVIRSFLTERWADRLDAATSGAHVIDSLWPGRTKVADLNFTLASRNAQMHLSALGIATQAKRSAKTALKTLAARAGVN